MYLARKVSGHIYVLDVGYMYLARKVSGHIYVLDVGVYVPSQESQRSYICVRCRGICT